MMQGFRAYRAQGYIYIYTGLMRWLRIEATMENFMDKNMGNDMQTVFGVASYGKYVPVLTQYCVRRHLVYFFTIRYRNQTSI